MLKIEIEDEKSKARTGTLRTAHGDLKTPAFLPVATKGAVKTLTPHELRKIGTQGIIVNSLHFLLRGKDAVTRAGGIHEFMNWERVVFTDCGGFQLIRKDFSFKLSEEGMSFKMRDGAPFVLDPVSSIHLQEEMRADVAFSLDDCPSLGSDRERVLLSMDRTTKWAKESLEAHEGEDTQLFGIAQGGLEADLREDHARAISDLGFDGYGIGGLGLGEPKETTVAMVEASLEGLPRESPKHLLGIGSLEDLAQHISLGVDTFDSAFPTRNARHGAFFVGTDTHDIRKTGYEGCMDPLEKNCGCYACSEFTSGYIHHLYREKEMLAMRLLSIHNLAVVERWMEDTRTRIKEGTFMVDSDSRGGNKSCAIDKSINTY